MFRTVVKIDGMMCGMCEAHINDAIRRNFNVKKVKSSHSKGETVIESETDPMQLRLSAQLKRQVMNSSPPRQKSLKAGADCLQILCIQNKKLKHNGYAFRASAPTEKHIRIAVKAPAESFIFRTEVSIG